MSGSASEFEREFQREMDHVKAHADIRHSLETILRDGNRSCRDAAFVIQRAVEFIEASDERRRPEPRWETAQDVARERAS